MGLTDLQIRKLVPRSHRFEISDGHGLALRITPNGTKAWVFRYQFNFIPRRMTLGKYPGVTLADARELLAQAKKDLQGAVDPGLKAKEAKMKIKAEPTFSDLLSEFWEKELSLQRSGKDRKRLMTKDALVHWGNRKVSSITRRDAVLMLDAVCDRAPVTANRLQGILARIFNFASERGIIEHSPMARLRRGKEVARSRVLTDHEIKTLWEGLDLKRKDIDISQQAKLALKLVLLTGQRPGEVAGMRWEHISDGWWTIPAASSKTGLGNTVPLLPMALEVLEAARVDPDGSPFVFASTHRVGQPLTSKALPNAIRRHRTEMGIENPFTPHDLRRTLRTRLAELGVSDVVGEKLLGHKLQGVLAIYNRHDYADEKREALAKWEARLRSIVGVEKRQPGKVIQMEVRRHG